MESRQRGGLFTIAGIPVRIHFTWLFIAAYLAVLFSAEFSQLARAAEITDTRVLLAPWVWGILLTLALFACVLLHELAHVLVARRGGAHVRSITLMMLGGVSEIGDVERPLLELRMAVAGPLISLALGLGFYGLFRMAVGGPPDLQFGLFYLAQVNFVIGVFNLLPAFPMDGGRVLRSLLVNRSGRLRATRIAKVVGQIVAGALLLFGILGGSWWLVLIGLFIFIGGEAEYRALYTRAALAGVAVAEVYARRLALVPPDATVNDAAQAMIRAQSDVCLVASGGKVLGVVPAQVVAAIPVRQRATIPAVQPMRPVALASPKDEVVTVLRAMDDGRLDAAAVIEDGQIVGTLTREDIARSLALHAPAPRGA